MHLPLGAEYRRSFRDIPRLFYAGRKTAVRPRNGQGNSEGSFVHANGWYHPDCIGTAEDRKPLKEPKNDPADEMPCGGGRQFPICGAWALLALRIDQQETSRARARDAGALACDATLLVTKGTDARLSFSTGIRAAARASDRAYGPEVKGTAAEKIGDARSGRHPRL